MKKIKIILNIILSFILMIGIILSTFVIMADFYTNKKNIIKRFENINLYNSVYEEVREGFENYIYQSGLEISIIDKICTKEKVKNDVNSVINSMYGEGDSNIDTSEIRINLDNAINEYLATQGRKLSNEEQENISRFEDLIEESYKDEIALYQKGSNIISRKLPSILSKIRIIEITSIAITSAILIVLVVINAKKMSTAASYVGISIFASGIILLFAKNTITTRVNVNELLIFTKALTSGVVSIANSILDSISHYGMIYIFTGIALIVIMNYIELLDKK